MKKKSTRYQKRRIIICIISLLGVGLLIWIGGLAYQSYLNSQDKEKFEIIKQDMQLLRDDLNAANTNVEWELEAACRRARHVWSEGGVACRIGLDASKEVASDNEAKELIEQYNSHLQSNNFNFSPSGQYRATPPTFPDELKAGYSGQDFVHDKVDIACGTLYEIKDEKRQRKTAILNLTFACNSTARDMWFPEGGSSL